MSKYKYDMDFETVHTSPFYFISYSRQDIDKVKKIAKSLHKKGIPLWYDKDIDYGTKWKQVIGERIKDSEALLMFISYDLLHRDETFVEKEYAIASNYKKKIIVILLDKFDATDIPAKSQMFFAELMELNVINAYEMEREYLEQEIISAIDFKPLDSQNEIKETKEEINDEPVLVNNSNDIENSDNKKTSGLPVSKYVKKIVKVITIIILIFAALFILLLIIIYAPAGKKTDSSPGTSHNAVNSANSDNNTAANAIISFNESDSSVTEDETDGKLLKFSDKTTDDIKTELENITNADTIRINQCTGRFSDMIPLILQNTGLSKLIITDCSFEDSIDFSGFSQLQSLDTVTVSGCNLASLNGMNNFPNLKRLDVSRNNLSTLEGLETSIYIFALDISDNQIEDLSGMTNCSVLEYFNAGNNKIKDFSLLSKSSVFLRQVCISGNNAETDLSFLAESTELEMLDISSNNIKTLSNIKSRKIQYLWTDNCSLSKFDIPNYSSLKLLSAESNQLTDISNSNSVGSENIEYLNLSENQFSDVLWVRGSNYKVIDLHNNKINDISVSINSDSVIDLYIYGNPLTESYVLNDITFNTFLSYNENYTNSIGNILKYKVYFVDCPLDKQAVLEKTLETEEGVFNITSEQAEQESEKLFKSYIDYSYKW